MPTIDSTRPHIPIKEFRETGFLQESNREFFHPLGLGLEVRSGIDPEVLKEWFAKAGIQFGEDAIDNCMTLVRLLGMDDWHLSGVQDFRADPEGYLFGNEELADEVAATKRENVNAERRRHMEVRVALLGETVQQVGVTYPISDDDIAQARAKFA